MLLSWTFIVRSRPLFRIICHGCTQDGASLRWENIEVPNNIELQNHCWSQPCYP